jgi:hypothetical protein
MFLCYIFIECTVHNASMFLRKHVFSPKYVFLPHRQGLTFALPIPTSTFRSQLAPFYPAPVMGSPKSRPSAGASIPCTRSTCGRADSNALGAPCGSVPPGYGGPVPFQVSFPLSPTALWILSHLLGPLKPLSDVPSFSTLMTYSKPYYRQIIFALTKPFISEILFHCPT